jgi:DNA-binding response OmpR family regulator
MSDAVKTVLVVDDDPDARGFLTAVLTDNGFAATEAKDGNEALAAIAEAPPDLVALDITMPEKSGVAVYRRLREDDTLRHIPVIIITGVSDEFRTFISTRRHVPPPDEYIPKPVDHQQFLEAVKKLLPR